ncbi:MAG TPA: hypothetical protein PKD78_01960 [Saprospiraceae bacterium]|nr:hypothetical protein [Saprospiraceae bacterium]
MRCLPSLAIGLLLLSGTARAQSFGQPGWLSESYLGNMLALMWAVSGSEKPCPDLVLGRVEGHAMFDGGKWRVHISLDAARKFEASFGANADDAMADLIGHEIAHALRGDRPGLRFAHWGDASSKEAERRADLCGLFLAHMSGYDSALVVFDRIFPVLGIASGAGYPDVAERRTHDQKVVQKSQQLAGLFDFANMLLLTGDEVAMRHADYLYHHMDADQGFNAGVEFLELNYSRGLVTLLLAAKDEGMPYAFPMEVADPSVFPSGRPGLPYVEGNGEMLRKAEAHFDKVLGAAPVLRQIGDWGRLRNETIFHARLAKVCLHILRSDYSTAEREAQSLASQHASVPVWKDKADMVGAIARLRKNPADQTARNTLQIIETRSTNTVVKKYARHNLNVGSPYAQQITPPPCAAGFLQALPAPKLAGEQARSQAQGVDLDAGAKAWASAPNWVLKGDRPGFGYVLQAALPCPCVPADLNVLTAWAAGYGQYRLWPIKEKPGSYFIARADPADKRMLRCFRLTTLQN